MLLTPIINSEITVEASLAKLQKSFHTINVIRKFGKVTYLLRMKLNKSFDLNHLEAISNNYKFTKTDSI